MKKPLLAVWMEAPKEGERQKVNWEFGDNIECWPLIGVLESIKLDLLGMVDQATEEEDNK